MPRTVALSDPRAPSAHAPALAALDLGTNNCRLLVARPRGASFEVIDSFSRIVRLGEGVVASSRLAERAMARTIAALRVCARIMARHDVVRSRCVATEACRRARNSLEFIARVQRTTALSLEILPQEQEARLALLACLPLIEPEAEHVLLIDIGGGSTEVLWLDRRAGPGGAMIRFASSLPIGVVALSETFSGEPDPAAYAAMVRSVQAFLFPLEAVHHLRDVLAQANVQLLGTSGTVTTLAALSLDLPRYDRRRIDGVSIETEAVSAVSQRLRGMTNASRAAHPCIGPGRADLVVAGCAILEAILRSWPVQRLRVADRGLREGLLYTLMGCTLDDVIVDPAAQTEQLRRAGVASAALGSRAG